jgi:hypothetical protein
VICEDNNLCTDDSCEAGLGCAHAFNDKACDDGNPCTPADLCDVGSCKGSGKTNCDDANVCTTDACDSAAGCTHLPAEASPACDDQNPCTEGDACQGSVCGGKAKVCDDNKVCTLDTCDAGKGCLPAALDGLVCDDGDPCTELDHCQPINLLDGKCVGQPKTCDDKNPCTKDSCGQAGACQNVALEGSCDDSNACTVDTACQEGKCLGKPLKCNDGNLCTDDSCETSLGCVFLPNAASCSAGTCSETGTCGAGTCVAGKAVSCDDGNPCTLDPACTEAKGCAHPPATGGEACTSGGKTGQCWLGLCEIATCGDGACGYSESTATCAKDCPEGGGICEPGDKPCHEACAASLCDLAPDKPLSSCKADSGCTALDSCIAACSTPACEAACLKPASAAVLKLWMALFTCKAAKCTKDSWVGKKCQGGGPVWVQCIKACRSALCYPLEVACLGDPICASIDNCVDTQCSGGQPSCIKQTCATKDPETVGENYGPKALIWDQLDQCQQYKCLYL